MSDTPTHPFTFGTGVSCGRDGFTVIARIDALHEAGSLASEVLSWNARSGWSGFSVDWLVTRLVHRPKDGTLFGTGPSGFVFVREGKQTTEETIDPSDTGPRYRGDIRDLCEIGDAVYAAGLSRQMYRREAVNNWVHCDSGTVQALGDLEVAGFNTIHGLNADLIYAAGFGGEIWCCNLGQWASLPSPTNLVLTRILMAAPDKVYACGQKGTILEGHGEQWEVLDQSMTEDHFWDLVSFRDEIFLSTFRGIYKLDAKSQLQHVPFPDGHDWTFGFLHAAGGMLYSFGSKHIAASADGQNWQDLTPTK
jgi:hypothetical protein